MELDFPISYLFPTELSPSARGVPDGVASALFPWQRSGRGTLEGAAGDRGGREARVASLVSDDGVAWGGVAGAGYRRTRAQGCDRRGAVRAPARSVLNH